MLKTVSSVSSGGGGGGGVTQIVAGTNINVSPANGVGVVTISSTASGSLTYKGTWNASTNTPSLASGTGTLNNYYVVSVSGTTTIDGINIWSVGDWIIFNGTVWEKLDGSSNEIFSTITVTGSSSANTNAGPIAYGNLSYSDTGIIGSFANSTNGYIQIVLQNTNSGSSASSDYVVVNDTGTAYADFGVTSSTFSGNGAFYQPNSPYLYSGGSDLYIGTIGANAVHFVANNATTDAMTVNANNTVSLGNIAYVNSSNANVGTSVVNINMLNAAVNGLNAQIPVNYASTANLSVTYNNGASGVGATLTATANGALTLDGGSPTLGQRVLIKDQTTQLQNGAYTVTVVGTTLTPFILTRAIDYDQSSEIAAGDGFYVISGSTQSNQTWVQQTAAPVTVGTTAITFIQFGATPSTSILPISRGGTGANTAAQALANLGGVSTGKAIAMSIVFGGG